MKNQNALLDGCPVALRCSICVLRYERQQSTWRRSRPCKGPCAKSLLERRKTLVSRQDCTKPGWDNSWEPPNLGPPTLASTENKQAGPNPAQRLAAVLS